MIKTLETGSAVPVRPVQLLRVSAGLLVALALSVVAWWGKNWAFTLAFVCMGLELSITEFKQMGWKPVAVFLIVTVFNTLLALLIAWVLFTYLFPAAG